MFHIRLANAVRARLFRLFFARSFGRFGRGSLVVAPVGVEGPGRIFIGDGVYVAPQCYLAATPHTGEESCRLEVGDGCRIGRFNHIYATRRVILHPRVLTANGVYIGDNLHGFDNPHVPVMDQPVRQLRDTEIGEGSWLGHNSCVIGATIGKGCVIGANAVVTRDIPDYSVAVGAPAIVIRRLDGQAGVWRPTSPDGEFLTS